MTFGTVLYRRDAGESGVGRVLGQARAAAGRPQAAEAFLWALMFVIELAGLLIRHFVLAVRLFANMLAGHIVLA